MQKVESRPLFQRQQVSSDVLWGLTSNYSSYLYNCNGTTFSRDPLNLTGLNTKRDSGIAGPGAIGVGYTVSQRRFKEKKAKKTGQVVRLVLRVKSKRQMQKRNLVARKDDKGNVVQTPVNKQRVPIHNRSVFVQYNGLTPRVCVKVLRRGLTNYRRDLVPIAVNRLKRLYRFKIINKWRNRAEAKKATK